MLDANVSTVSIPLQNSITIDDIDDDRSPYTKVLWISQSSESQQSWCDMGTACSNIPIPRATFLFVHSTTTNNDNG